MSRASHDNTGSGRRDGSKARQRRRCKRTQAGSTGGGGDFRPPVLADLLMRTDGTLDRGLLLWLKWINLPSGEVADCRIACVDLDSPRKPTSSPVAATHRR
jgi:hypothetical protein